jgi:hypothetical protein
MVAACVLIVGCGGGGGSNATSNTTAATSPTPTVDPAVKIKELVDGKATELAIKNSRTLGNYFAKGIEPRGYTVEWFDGAVVEMNKK